jgi:hypothetical protein
MSSAPVVGRDGLATCGSLTCIILLEIIKPDPFYIGGVYFQNHFCPFSQELRYVRDVVRVMDLWCCIQLL